MPERNSPEEIANIAKSRTLSDANKIQEGAAYVMDEGSDKPRLEFTKEQIEEAREEMEDALVTRKEAPKITPRIMMMRTLSNFQTRFDEDTIDSLDHKLSRYEGDADRISLAYVIAKNYAISEYRKKETEGRQQAKLAAGLILREEGLMHENKEREEFGAAKQEFWNTANKILKSKSRLQQGMQMMTLLYKEVFMGEKESNLPSAAPEQHRQLDVRRQHRHRARAYISNSDDASLLLKKVIWNPRYRKYATK